MDILVFNRVPKTGSMQLIDLMKKLGKIHDYSVTVDEQFNGIKAILDENEQEEYADQIANMNEPSSFVSHINFLNFTKFEQTRPIYINMVRDPVERAISWFYYVRSPWIFIPQRKRRKERMPVPKWIDLDFDQCVKEKHPNCIYTEGSTSSKNNDHRRQTLFFCGQNRKECLPFNGKVPLQIAKRNVEKEYAVVGSWEDTNITLAVLENYVPRYFKGAKQVYYIFLAIYSQIFNLNADDYNNTKQAEMDIIVFNRVPKTGSMQLINLMKQLGKIHDYSVTVDEQFNGIKAILDENEQEEYADQIANMVEPSSFVSHINFLNFTKYEQTRPIYINMVRDPVERVISWFYYIRSPWIFIPQRKKHKTNMPDPKCLNLDFDQCVKEKLPDCIFTQGSTNSKNNDHRRQTLFFCGHNRKNCLPFNDKKPLQIAKRNVEKEYAVIGSWEDTNITLTVLENYIPRYFKGATQVYYMGLQDNIKNKNPMKPHISEEIKDIVRKNFTREIEFYQFCKQRLYKQYLAIKLDDIMNVDKSLTKETINK